MGLLSGSHHSNISAPVQISSVIIAKVLKNKFCLWAFVSLFLCIVRLLLHVMLTLKRNFLRSNIVMMIQATANPIKIQGILNALCIFYFICILLNLRVYLRWILDIITKNLLRSLHLNYSQTYITPTSLFSFFICQFG